MKTEKLQKILIAAEVARSAYLDKVKEAEKEAERLRDACECLDERTEEGEWTPENYALFSQVEDVLDLIEWEQEKCRGFYGTIMYAELGDVSWEQEEAISTEHRYW